MAGYTILKLKDMIEELSESECKNILAHFSCPINIDVEYFISKKAIEFEKQSYSTTYLVYAQYKGENLLAGFYNIANKFIVVGEKALSKSTRKKIVKFGSYNNSLKSFIVPAPLIGQLAINYKYKDLKLISGKELLKMATDLTDSIQLQSSGKVCYLECEDQDRLIEFYTSNGFVVFTKRNLDADEKDKHSSDYLLQLIRIRKNA